MDQPLVVIVVLNWNGRADTLACLDSLQALTYPNYQVLVVDNASQDGSEVAIREEFPDLPLLQTGDNLGYAGGNNAGIGWALQRGADYVLILNNDTTVGPGMVDAMVERARREDRVGIVGASIAYDSHPDRLWAYGGGRFDIATGWVRHVQSPTPDDELQTHGTVHYYITGCTMLLSRSLLENVGELDTSYFHFCEDVDLCLRAESAGFKVAVAPGAHVRHKVSATTKVSSPLFLYYNLRSRLSLVRRHGPPGAPGRRALAMLWLRLWRPALLSGLGRSGWRALGRAYADYNAGRTGPAPADLLAGNAARTARGAVLLAVMLAWLCVGSVAGAQVDAPCDDVNSCLLQLSGSPPAPARIIDLLWDMAEDPDYAAAVLERAGPAQRRLTSSLLVVLRATDPEARALLPQLHVVRDDSPPPDQRPPAWSDVRRQGLMVLEQIAPDPEVARDVRLVREINRDRLSQAVGHARPSEIAARLGTYEDWWGDRGMDEAFYLDPDLRPDLEPWLTQLRAPLDDGGAPVIALVTPLQDDVRLRRAVCSQLSADTDAGLTKENMDILRMYREDFEREGFPPRRWNPDAGRLEGYSAAQLREVALDLLACISTHASSGMHEGEIIENWLEWWRGARFQARYYRDPHQVPTMASWLEGLDLPVGDGGQSVADFLRHVYIANGFTDIILDQLDSTNEGLVAELIEWLGKDRGDAVAAGFDITYRWLPLRPRPGETGRIVAIPWPKVQELNREMLRRITGDEGLPEVGVAEAERNQFWFDWWSAHRREPRWYRSRQDAPAALPFEMEKGQAAG